jgi:hypothetical protein
MEGLKFKPGDIVKLTVTKKHENTFGILQNSYRIGNEIVWQVFHFESNRSFRVFEHYIAGIVGDEDGGRN